MWNKVANVLAITTILPIVGTGASLSARSAHIGWAPNAVQEAKPRLAIKALENPTADMNSTIGNALTDILFTELGRTGRFRLVERGAFEEVAAEVDFGSTDWVKPGTAAARGSILGAEFVLLGKVSNFSFSEDAVTQNVQTPRGLVAQVVYRQNAGVRVDFRVVSVATGEAVITESGTDSQSRISAVSEIATYRRLVSAGVFSAEAQNSFIGRTTVNALKNVVRKISDLAGELALNRATTSATSAVERLGSDSGEILADAGGAFIVTLGSDAGIRQGDHLRVFAEQVTKDSRGAVAYREEAQIATLQVVDVSMGDRSKATLLGTETPTRKPREGDRVRVDLEHARDLRSAGASGPRRPATGATEPSEIERLVRLGDRYVEDRYFAQAVETYRSALAIQPDSPPVMDKLVTAMLYNKQLVDAEELMLRLFELEGKVNVGVVHNHTFGMCVGTLELARTGISYSPIRGGHGFDADIDSVLGFTEGRAGNLPAMSVRHLDGRKEHKLDFIVPAYLGRARGELFASPSEVFRGDAQALEDTARIHRMLVRLAEDRILRQPW